MRMIINVGFTLIELVTVILLVAILSAIVLPKCVDLTSQAKVASEKALSGAFAAAISISRAKWISEQGTVSKKIGVPPKPAFIRLEDGSVVYMNDQGWPQSVGQAPNDIGLIDHDECSTLWAGLLNTPPAASDKANRKKKDFNDPGQYLVAVASDTEEPNTVCQFRGQYGYSKNAIQYNTRNGEVKLVKLIKK